MAGTLYIAATPIGNLEDVTYRVIRVLAEVSFIACEDTRHTRRLLDRYGLSQAQLVSFHEHNERDRTAELIAELQSGRSVALVSDAGTPLISDPGFRLVREARSAGIPVVPLPGPSAVMAALSASGQPTDAFYFGGFLPEKEQARREELLRHRDSPFTLVYFEAPHRLTKSLAAIGEMMPARPVTVARELTKIHEEFAQGSGTELAAHFEGAASGRVRGECTIVIGKPATTVTVPGEPQLLSELAALMASGKSRSEAAKELAHRYGLPRRQLYDLGG